MGIFYTGGPVLLGLCCVLQTQPVTARSLETMIRLSGAHAKARLSTKIELQDAETAVELVQFAYFKKVSPVAGLSIKFFFQPCL